MNRIDSTGAKWDLSGLIFQFFVSVFFYESFTVASVFDKDIRADMKSINYNPFNTDEDLVVNSKFVSFYRGVPVIRTPSNIGGCFSFGIIGLAKTNNVNNSGYYDLNYQEVALQEVLKHERGHNTQLMVVGVLKFSVFIAVPSALANPNESDRLPWELSASILGNSSLSNHTTDEEKIESLLYILFLIFE